jgi:hypothetical protein
MIVPSSQRTRTGKHRPIQHWFESIHGKRAFARLRSRLDDPTIAYQDIGSKFGLTRQRIAQIAAELGININAR